MAKDATAGGGEPLFSRRDGELLPARFELTEASGPVSPAFQYKLRILVVANGDGVRLSYEDVGEYEGGKPRRNRKYDGPLTRKGYERLVRELAAEGMLELGERSLTPAPQARVGVSYNQLSVTVGKRTLVKVVYTLARLKTSEGATLAKVIARLRRVLRLKLMG